MFHEYAVEPRAIGSSWEAFRYIIEKFGFDRGRLISEYPKPWLREVYDAGLGLPPVEKKRIEEKLIQAKRNKLVRFVRPYDREAGDWLFNAIARQADMPFHAIIATANPDAHDAVLVSADLDELNPLMTVPHDCAIARDAASLSAAMDLLLRCSHEILFVDPYYDPFNARYQRTLRACLNIVHEGNPKAVCEIHHIEHKLCAPVEGIEKAGELKFKGVIPDGMTVSIFRWKEKDGGEDFHARYLLTDRGGIRIDAGFSAEGKHQTTDFGLMDFDLSQTRRAALARDSDVYELVEPVLKITHEGKVERI